MNILITGHHISSIAKTLVKELVKEQHKIVVVAENTADWELDVKNVVTHSINPAETLFLDALSAYKFDFVIYIPLREEQLNDNYLNTGEQLDG